MSYLNADIVLVRENFRLSLDCAFDAPITGIFGSSGAGKTTLLNCIAGLAVPDEGRIGMQSQVLFDSSQKINLPLEMRRIGYVFQEGRLFPHLNVTENLRFGERLLKPSQRQIAFDEVVELLEVGPLVHKKIKGISGGQAQRVAIGRALLTSPKLLLFDEPFAGLDVRLRGQVIPFLKRISSTYGIPMLVVSHDLQDLLKLTSQLLLMNEGKNMGHGPFTKLLADNDSFDMLNRSGLVNTADVVVKACLEKEGILELSVDGGHLLRAEINSENAPLHPGKMVTISMRPEDVTLASHRIEDISIQNQLRGMINQVIFKRNKAVCLIDAGITLIAEVTVATAKNMGLVQGKGIWCLIKAAAIKVNC